MLKREAKSDGSSRSGNTVLEFLNILLFGIIRCVLNFTQSR